MLIWDGAEKDKGQNQHFHRKNEYSGAPKGRFLLKRIIQDARESAQTTEYALLRSTELLIFTVYYYPKPAGEPKMY